MVAKRTMHCSCPGPRPGSYPKDSICSLKYSSQSMSSRISTTSSSLGCSTSSARQGGVSFDYRVVSCEQREQTLDVRTFYEGLNLVLEGPSEGVHGAVVRRQADSDFFLEDLQH